MPKGGCYFDLSEKNQKSVPLRRDFCFLKFLFRATSRGRRLKVNCAKASLEEIIKERGKTSKNLLLCTSKYFLVGTPEQLIRLVFEFGIKKWNVEILMNI